MPESTGRELAKEPLIDSLELTLLTSCDLHCECAACKTANSTPLPPHISLTALRTQVVTNYRNRIGNNPDSFITNTRRHTRPLSGLWRPGPVGTIPGPRRVLHVLWQPCMAGP